MAVTSLIGPSVTFYQGDQALRTFSSQNANQHNFGDCYLEVANDGPFTITIWIPQWMPLLGHFLLAIISLDGKMLPPYRLLPHGQQTHIEGYFAETQAFPFTFGALTFNDTAADDLPDSHIAALGTIEIRLKHATDSNVSTRPIPVSFAQPQVSDLVERSNNVPQCRIWRSQANSTSNSPS